MHACTTINSRRYFSVTKSLHHNFTGLETALSERLEAPKRALCPMVIMDIITPHHMVLWISILPDLATVRSYCNGLTVTFDRLRTLCQG